MDKKVITNTEGNAIGLVPNQISKVRVYMAGRPRPRLYRHGINRR